MHAGSSQVGHQGWVGGMRRDCSMLQHTLAQVVLCYAGSTQGSLSEGFRLNPKPQVLLQMVFQSACCVGCCCGISLGVYCCNHMIHGGIVRGLYVVKNGSVCRCWWGGHARYRRFCSATFVVLTSSC